MVRYKGVQTLEVLTWAHNYNAWIGRTLRRYLHAPVLEFGAGLGTISKQFFPITPLTVTDIDPHLVKKLEHIVQGKPNIFAKRLDMAKKLPRAFLGKYNSVVSVNVLEHIKDDEKVLRTVFNILKGNGVILLLVPAKKFAYTKLDKALGHFRRYEKNELKEKLERSGFVVEHIFFFNIVGLMSWMIRDRMEQTHTSLRPYQIWLFEKIVPILALFERFIPIPMGISLIAVARKPMHKNI